MPKFVMMKLTATHKGRRKDKIIVGSIDDNLMLRPSPVALGFANLKTNLEPFILTQETPSILTQATDKGTLSGTFDYGVNVEGNHEDEQWGLTDIYQQPIRTGTTITVVEYGWGDLKQRIGYTIDELHEMVDGDWQRMP